jgi:hypothetical protein
MKSVRVIRVIAKPVSSKGKGGRVTIVENGVDGRQIHHLAAQAPSRDSMRASSNKKLKLKEQPTAVEQITDTVDEDDTYISPPMNANHVPVHKSVA